MIQARKRCIASRLAGTVWIVGAALLSTPVWAHSSDTLTARLVYEGGPDVSLEITADVASTPWLKDTPNPALAMAGALRVAHQEGRSWSPSELGAPIVSVSDGFKYPTPPAVAHGHEGSNAELLTAVWKWRPSVSPLFVEVPKDHPASVMLWTVDNRFPNPSPKGQLLLGSDRSHPIELPFKPNPLQWNWQARLATLVAMCGIVLQGLVLFLRIRRRRMA